MILKANRMQHEKYVALGGIPPKRRNQQFAH